MLGDVISTTRLDSCQKCFTLGRRYRRIQLLQCGKNNPALPADLINRLLFFCRIRKDVGITQLTGNNVDRLNNVVGQADFWKFVVRHFLDFGSKGGESHIADAGDDHHQHQCQGESYTQAHAYLDIVHEVFLFQDLRGLHKGNY